MIRRPAGGFCLLDVRTTATTAWAVQVTGRWPIATLTRRAGERSQRRQQRVSRGAEQQPIELEEIAPAQRGEERRALVQAGAQAPRRAIALVMRERGHPRAAGPIPRGRRPSANHRAPWRRERPRPPRRRRRRSAGRRLPSKERAKTPAASRQTSAAATSRTRRSRSTRRPPCVMAMATRSERTISGSTRVRNTHCGTFRVDGGAPDSFAAIAARCRPDWKTLVAPTVRGDSLVAEVGATSSKGASEITTGRTPTK